MRTNKYGDSLWTKKYSSGVLFGIVKASDTNFTISGIIDTSKLAIQIATINLNGDTSMFRDYGYPPPSYSTGIEITSDRGYVMRNSQSYDYEFLKLDSNLSEQWHYNIFNMPNGCAKIKPVPFGGYVATGSGWVPQQPYVVSRLDNSGIQIWQQVYGNQPAWDIDTHYPTDIVVLPDSNYLVGCDGHDWQLMKINYLNGDTIWTKNFDSTGNHQWNDYKVFDLDTAGNNRYICAMSRYITLLDENGDSIWCKTKPFPYMYIHDIHKTLDGGFAMCGSIPDFSTNTTILAFAKLDSLGNSVFTFIYDPESNFQPLIFFPNPAQNELYISTGDFAKENNLIFSLHDLQGREILYQKYDKSKSIDLSSVPNGIYIATLKGKEKEKRGKVIIRK